MPHDLVTRGTVSDGLLRYPHNENRLNENVPTQEPVSGTPALTRPFALHKARNGLA